MLRKSGTGKAVLTESIKSAAGKTKHKLPQPQERPSLPSRTSSMPKSVLKVLIVEDNLVNQRVLQKQLKNLGCITHVANHGGEALDILNTSRFWKGHESDGIELAVVLMDLEVGQNNLMSIRH